jgi:hypothetical protein
VSIALLLIIERFEVLSDHQIDRGRRRVREIILQFLRVHCEMLRNARKLIDEIIMVACHVKRLSNIVVPHGKD